KLNRLDAAESAANQYLALAKDDPDGLFQLGAVKLAKDQLDDALKLFRRVARMQPDTMNTLMDLKRVLFRLGELKEADEIGKRIEEVQRRKNEELSGAAQTKPGMR